MTEAGSVTTANGEKLTARGKVTGLNIYPVKSMGRMEVDKLHCTEIGTQLPGSGIYDRYFLAIKRNGMPATLTEFSKMCLITPSARDNKLILDAPGMPTLTIPDKVEKEESSVLHKATVLGQETCGIDCGKEAGEWLSKFLGKEDMKIAYFAQSELRRPANGGLLGAVKAPVPESVELTYSNSAPYMLLSKASVENLNTKLEKPATVHNFRPNIVMEGCDSHLEDTFDVVQIGSAIFRLVTHNPRCIIITTDMEAGVKDPKMEPMKTLRTYRPIAKHNDKNAPMMGVYLILEKEGEIKVGDTVYASTITPVYR